MRMWPLMCVLLLRLDLAGPAHGEHCALWCFLTILQRAERKIQIGHAFDRALCALRLIQRAVSIFLVLYIDMKWLSLKHHRILSELILWMLWSFDNMNLERLRMAMEQTNNTEYYFDFDPTTIDWDDYFYRVHIPGVLKYLAWNEFHPKPASPAQLLLTE